MQWADVVRAPSRKHLRQFAGLCLLVFGAWAAWRWTAGARGGFTVGLAAFAAIVGIGGLVAPALVRPIYTGWMIAAFPIGWTVSRLVLGFVFFAVVTPIAQIFRLSGRDALALRRGRGDSYWTDKRAAAGAREYFRQS